MKINLQEALKRQEQIHTCKKDEICSKCGKICCELCCGFHGLNFDPICYECEGKEKGEKKMENEKRKLGRNVVSEKDAGDHILQTRKVFREGMLKEITYNLKIPKTLKSAEAIYGDEWLRLGIASLKTENDDAIETSGKPISQDKAFKTAFKNASPQKREEIAKMLGISVSELESKEKVATAETKKK